MLSVSLFFGQLHCALTRPLIFHGTRLGPMTLHARRAELHSRMRHCYGRNDGRLGVFLTTLSSDQVPAGRRCYRHI
jgi:hypothetical protein